MTFNMLMQYKEKGNCDLNDSVNRDFDDIEGVWISTVPCTYGINLQLSSLGKTEAKAMLMKLEIIHGHLKVKEAVTEYLKNNKE